MTIPAQDQDSPKPGGQNNISQLYSTVPVDVTNIRLELNGEGLIQTFACAWDKGRTLVCLAKAGQVDITANIHPCVFGLIIICYAIQVFQHGTYPDSLPVYWG